MKSISYVNKKGQGHYYYVRIYDAGIILIQDTFLVSQYGSQEKALVAAIEWRDAMWKHYGLPKSKFRSIKRIKRPSNTGHHGVSRIDYVRPDTGYHNGLYQAHYRVTVNGKRVTKSKRFSYRFISEESALQAAIKYRAEMEKLHYDKG